MSLSNYSQSLLHTYYFQFLENSKIQPTDCVGMKCYKLTITQKEAKKGANQLGRRKGRLQDPV